MQLIIELTPQQGAALSAAAQRLGIDQTELVREILTDRLPEFGVSDSRPDASEASVETPDAENRAAIALLDSWLKEDATDDPEEIRKAEEELAEFRRNMNANRALTGERPVYP